MSGKSFSPVSRPRQRLSSVQPIGCLRFLGRRSGIRTRVTFFAQEGISIVINDSASSVLKILEKPRTENSQSGVLSVGGIEFGTANPWEPQDRFVALDNTLGEAKAVLKIFNDDQLSGLLLTGDEVTKEKLSAQISNYANLHIASHGFRLSKLVGVEEQQAARHPLLESCIALSNANVSEDGKISFENIFTGREILQLNLGHVDLAVLSTCHSALGRLSDLEGIFGIEKTLRLSGARTTLTSQSAIDDLAAKRFVESFFKHVVSDGMGKARAFQQTQQEMIDQKIPVQLWAGWRLAGEWR